jgi:hypothetical protein
MKRNELIKNVIVSNQGIKISRADTKNLTGNKNITMIINNMTSLDTLRKATNDFQSRIPAAQVYTNEYFQLNASERRNLRCASSEIDGTEDLEVSDLMLDDYSFNNY